MTDQQVTITDDQRATFANDGVVHIPVAVGPERVDQIRRIADQVLAAPSRFSGDTFIELGHYPADDDHFPRVWSR